MDREEALQLVEDGESDLVERKESLAHPDRIQQAICAFANDLPDHRKPGYILIGVSDSGKIVGDGIDDKLLLRIASFRDSGRILPIPHFDIHTISVDGKSFVVVRVFPSNIGPVRFEGLVWIRVGPRRAVATPQEERRLSERYVAGTRSFDRRPCLGTGLKDLLLESFRAEYLPGIVSREVLQANHRDAKEQLASLRFFDLREDAPTNAGILIVGKDPIDVMPGAYIQFARYNGVSLSDSVIDQKELSGNLMTQLRQLEELLTLQVRVARQAGTTFRHDDIFDYPSIAVRELVFNAVMHRSYEGTNSPTRINWFTDRVEIQNPGGLFGYVTPENFTRANDYRNPVIAEAMKALGYVERFGVGITRSMTALKNNGNPNPEFVFEPGFVLVIVRAKL